MKLDIRTPIGGMFLVDGVVLVLHGLFGNANMAQTQGTNINLWWGLLMTVFGGTMLGFALRARKSGNKTAQPPSATAAH